jgi:hypothetical protein
MIKFLQIYGTDFWFEYRHPGTGHLLWSNSYKFTVLSFQSSIDIQALATCSDQILTNLRSCLFNRVSISRHWPPALTIFLQIYGTVFSIEYRHPGTGPLLWSNSYKPTVLSFQSSFDIQALATCSDHILTNLRYCLFNRISTSRHWPPAVIKFLQTYDTVFSIEYRYPGASRLFL